MLANLSDRFAEADAGLGISLNEAYGEWRTKALERESAAHLRAQTMLSGVAVGIVAALCAKAVIDWVSEQSAPASEQASPESRSLLRDTYSNDESYRVEEDTAKKGPTEAVLP